MTYPHWTLLHIPHSSTFIPPSVREQFCVSDEKLTSELIKMTDHFTLQLFGAQNLPHQTIAAEVSRLVVDVERFEDDRAECMAAMGMGAIYTVTSDLLTLRRALTHAERVELIHRYYRDHHRKLTARVEETLATHDRCLIIDGHSFPSTPLKYELDQGFNRPDICIGTDEFHTPSALTTAMVASFESAGFSVSLNSPFSGALVPIEFYKKERRVSSIMVEVNRKLYLNEQLVVALPGLDLFTQKLSRACGSAICSWVAG